jgi:endosialidase-like protein
MNTALISLTHTHTSCRRPAVVLIPLLISCALFSQQALSLTPPPVGGYAGQNTATGDYALFNLTNGTRNTAIGFQALNTNTTGGKNTAIGFFALQDNPTGTNNIALGYTAGIFTQGNNNINIGNVGAEESDTIRIGTVNGRGIRDFQKNTYIAGISGVTIAAGVPFIIDADGHLGSITSSERFKDEVKPMDKASEAILALKPVAFRYKTDTKGVPQFGLIAEEVAEVNPDLVVRDKNGEIYSVRYDAVNAMLLNEFLKEHRKVEQLEKQVEMLTTGLRKISAEIEATKPTAQVALKDK